MNHFPFSSAEQRLIRLNLSDFNNFSVRGRRAARDRDEIQRGGRGGSDANILYNQQSYQDALGRDALRRNVYNNSLAGNRTTVNFGIRSFQNQDGTTGRGISPLTFGASPSSVVANRNIYGDFPSSTPRVATREERSQFNQPTGENFEEIRTRASQAGQTYEALKGKDAATRMKELGISDTFIKVKSALDSIGLTPGGSQDGRMILGSVSEEQLAKLRGAGLSVVTGEPDENGRYKVELPIGEGEWGDYQEAYEYVNSGKDLEEAKAASEQATADAQANRPTEISGEEFTEESGGGGGFGGGAGEEGAPQFDMTPFENTRNDILDFSGALSGLSTEVQGAYSPLLQAQLSQLGGVDRSLQDILDTFQTDEEIEAVYGGGITRAMLTEQRYLDLLDRNKETSEQLATYKRDAAKLDLDILKVKNAQEESRAINSNLQNEKKLRRQLNALGIQSDVRGLNFMNSQISQMEQNLQFLRQFNSLNEAKINMAVTDGYVLDMKDILNQYEGKYLDINNQTDEKIDSIKNSISLAKSERNKGIREAYKDSADRKNELEISIAENLRDANEKHVESLDAQRKESNKNALSLFEFAFTESTDPNLRKSAVQGMIDAGYSMDNIDLDAPLVSMQLQAMKDAAAAEKKQSDNLVADLYGQMEVGGLDVGFMAANALEGRSSRTLTEGAASIQELIDAGDKKGIKTRLMVMARANMRADERKRFTAANEGLDDIEIIFDRIEKFKGSYGGKWKEAYENAKKWQSLAKRDKDWIALKASIAAAQADIRNRYAGVAVTETEQKFLNDFLINFEEDDVRAMVVKLDELKENMTIEVQSRVDDVLDPIDRRAYKALTGESAYLDSSTLDGTDQKEYGDDYFEGLYLESQEGENDLVSKTYSNRKVTLARPAASAFSFANADFKEKFGTDIKIGAVATSSYRPDQRDAIKSVAKNAGIPYYSNNPNATAKKLSDMGYPVAGIGGSLHEKGRAVDLYPFDVKVEGKVYTGHEYIALVRPFLEKYGFMKVNHQGNDPGNFEFPIS